MLALLAMPAGHAQSIPDYAPFAPGWAAYQERRIGDAGRLWEQASVGAESAPDTLRVAALAAVLAAFAMDRSHDARAADLWTRATNLYVRAGQSWSRQRSALSAEVARARSAGASQMAPGVPAAVPPLLRMLADLDERDHLLSYDGPHVAPDASLAPARTAVGIGVGYLGGGGAIARNDPGGSVYSNLASSVGGPAAVPRVQAPVATNAPSGQNASPGGDGEAALYQTAARNDRSDAVRMPSTCDAGASALPAGAWQAVTKSAWSYFVANRQPATGLVNGKRAYPYITASDIAGTLAALVVANQLGLGPAAEIEPWLRQVLATLRDLPRYGGELPARQYDARSGGLVGLDNNPSPTGSGYSLYEIARILVWTEIVAACYPDLRAEALGARADWRFGRATALGRLHGVLARDGVEHVYIDETLGYKEYAAAALTLTGLPMPQAFSYAELRTTSVDGGPVLYDARPASLPTSDPFILGTLELGGIDGCFRRIVDTMYAAQARHATRTGQPVALGAEAIDRAPWFSYSTVYAGGQAWKAASYDVQADATLRIFSAKTAIGWAAAFNDRHAAALLASAVRFARDGGVGVGQYESGNNVDATSLDGNAQILEAAWYVARGRRAFVAGSVAGPAICPALQDNPVR
ncbi:DUF3131 domain-containing protein [Burkholderia lata]|uniref:DUF3131 domain-containing protein n=1 Tax=Burkholderia lata (strain ATCC 17760 / DSM 23089 / LMG 22485 / NCIMB 9086 / R18194 / 383) TaxID=482957 RepID=UPI0015836A8E|nr:DUF3131 domain-containing protein [Burkholderia lata]